GGAGGGGGGGTGWLGGAAGAGVPALSSAATASAPAQQGRVYGECLRYHMRRTSFPGGPTRPPRGGTPAATPRPRAVPPIIPPVWPCGHHFSTRQVPRTPPPGT